MTERDQLVLLRAITLWDYNVGPKEQFEKAWGVAFNERDGYHIEKLAKVSTSGLLAWSADLSRSYQARMMRAVMERYGEEADRWVGHDGTVFGELASASSNMTADLTALIAQARAVDEDCSQQLAADLEAALARYEARYEEEK